MSFKSGFSLTIDFLAGTDIKDAIIQASEFAEKLNISYVKFKFNGVQCSVPQNADIDHGIMEFSDQYRKVSGYVLVNRKD